MRSATARGPSAPRTSARHSRGCRQIGSCRCSNRADRGRSQGGPACWPTLSRMVRRRARLSSMVAGWGPRRHLPPGAMWIWGWRRVRAAASPSVAPSVSPFPGWPGPRPSAWILPRTSSGQETREPLETRGPSRTPQASGQSAEVTLAHRQRGHSAMEKPREEAAHRVGGRTRMPGSRRRRGSLLPQAWPGEAPGCGTRQASSRPARPRLAGH